MKTSSFFAFLAAMLLISTPARALETAAQYALLVDYDTGSVLFEKNAGESMHPSSMSKLMTAYVLFDRLKSGRVKLDDAFKVSEKAWRTQGSKMFVHVGDTVKVEDLIRGIVIQSGNDACVTVAEGISGSEEAFAGEMNRTAQKIGLTGSHFVNATGWPDEKHQMTPRDLATLASRIIADFPEYYHYYSETSFTYSNITQGNRNRLLGNDIGVDGLKTGHTDVAGYGITLSAKDPKSGRRQILVINGLPTEQARVDEGDRLLRYGFREFVNRTLARAGEKVEEAEVWFGREKTVPLVAEKDVMVTLPANAQSALRFTVRYNGPLTAPVEKGAHVADLVVVASEGTMPPMTIPLVAGEGVEKLSGIGKALANLKYLITGAP